MQENQAGRDQNDVYSYEINRVYKVRSLMEELEIINEFSAGEKVWFRGHASCDYHLLPTLYRGKNVSFREDEDKNFNSMHMAEQVRIQQYYAKDYPFIKNSGHNTLEWLGMGQHFGINTRFLDWSGSAVHSTIFALESYFEKADYEGEQIPCVWVLKPQKMNKRIVDQFFQKEWIEKYQDDYFHDAADIKEVRELIKEIKENKGDELRKVFIESEPENKWTHMDYIFNVAYFDHLLKAARINPKLGVSQNVTNPVFLFLALVYIEGVAMENDVLDSVPLAVIHPLNNERIREQRGAFTLFPFPSKNNYKEAGNNLDYMRMEYNPCLKGTLCKIELLRPRKICEELRTIGAHRSWLYNEPEFITKEIESGL